MATDEELFEAREAARLAEAEAGRLVAAAGAGAVVEGHFDDADGAFLQRVAAAFAAAPGAAIAFLTADAPGGALFALAAQEVATADLRALGMRVAAALGGRGGGAGRAFQGKAPSLAGRAAALAELRAAAREAG